MMSLIRILAPLLMIVALARPAEGHFVWIVCVAAGDGPRANLYFAETPEPGGAHLIEKIAHAQAWLCRPKQRAEVLPLEQRRDGESGRLTAMIGATSPYAISADCEYGVFRRGEKSMLLHYYARSIGAASSAELAELATETGPVALAILPKVNAAQAQLFVNWQGKPAGGAQVFVIAPDGRETELTTDDQGVVQLDNPAPGQYAVRARVVLAEPGDKAGEHYEQAWHIATLTTPLAFATAATAGQISANDLLAKARAARAVWNDFPGFTANLVIAVDGKQSQATIKVDGEGEIELSEVEGPDASWIKQQLATLVRHRLPVPFSDDAVHYADEDAVHPLGRLIQFEDDSSHSAYRIKGDIITEVNRSQGGMRFTISTLAVTRNPQGKYLPQDFSASFWDAGTGALKANETCHDEWLRRGPFELPLVHVVVRAENNSRKVLRVDFKEHRLLDNDRASR